MSITRYQRLSRLINTVMGFLTVLPALLLALYYFGSLSDSWTLLPLFGAAVAAWALREFCPNLVLFAAGTLLCLTTSLPAKGIHPLLFLLFLLVTAGLVVLNFVLRLRPAADYRGKNLARQYFILPITAQALCVYLDYQPLIPFILSAALCQILLRFLNEYLLNYIRFLQEVRTAKSIPLGQIKSSNGWLMTAFLSLSGVLMILSCFVPFGNLLQKMFSGALSVFRYLIYLFLRLFINKDAAAPEPAAAPGGVTPDFGMDDSTPSAFWTFLERFFQIAFVFLVIVGGTALLLYLIYHVGKAFYSRRTLTTDRVEFLNPFEKKEKLEKLPVEEGHGGLLDFFGISPNARIRKSWYKTVKTKHPGQVPGFLAPAELGETLSKEETEKAAAKKLAGFYDKARYSGKECGKEELAEAKQLAARLKQEKK